MKKSLLLLLALLLSAPSFLLAQDCQTPENVKVKVVADDPNYGKKYQVILSWDAVEGADRYWVNAYKDGNQIIPSNYWNGTSMDLTNYLLDAGSYTFTVQAYSFDSDTAASDMVTSDTKVKENATLYPLNLHFGTGANRYTLFWDSIPSTNGYWIKVKKDGATLSDRTGFGGALTGRFYF